ncbi:MAG TPA: galactose ABC transporter substrate-binding protein, partial [Anaerolineae bacterium]|nr:galactose ABC transporter substrate-binding protein [Anaerolineae bacterium]
MLGKHRFIWLTAVLALFLLAAAGCGGQDTQPAPEEPATEEEQPAQAEEMPAEEEEAEPAEEMPAE